MANGHLAFDTVCIFPHAVPLAAVPFLWGLRKLYLPGSEHVVGGPSCVGRTEGLSFLESIKIDCSCGELNTNSIAYPIT